MTILERHFLQDSCKIVQDNALSLHILAISSPKMHSLQYSFNYKIYARFLGVFCKKCIARKGLPKNVLICKNLAKIRLTCENLSTNTFLNESCKILALNVF